MEENIKDKMGLDGELRQLNSAAPQGAKQTAMSGAMEVVVDATMQQLNKMRTFEAMTMQVPAMLPPEAQMVLQPGYFFHLRQKVLQMLVEPLNHL